MRKGLIALGLLGLLFLGLMLFAPGGGDSRTPPDWTRMLGRVLGGFAPRLRSLEGQTQLALAPGAARGLAVPAAPGQKLRLLTLRHLEGGPVLATFTCRPTAEAACDPPEATACLGQPLDPGACREQAEKRDPGQELSFTLGPGGGQLALKAGPSAARVGVAQ